MVDELTEEFIRQREDARDSKRQLGELAKVTGIQIGKQGVIKLIVKQITMSATQTNDSFVLGHPINSIVYGATETSLINDFETSTGWTGTGATVTNDSTAGHFQIGTQGVNAAWTGTGLKFIGKTITSIDISGSTGVSSGTPTRGTIGLWVYVAEPTKVTGISLSIGSDASNRANYTGQTFAQRNSLTGTFSLATGLNYILFDLNIPDTVTGTPVWTGVTLIYVLATINAATNTTFDYLTVSKSNDIGLNGLGSRSLGFGTIYDSGDLE